jgi:hypothetical protein
MNDFTIKAERKRTFRSLSITVSDTLEVRYFLTVGTADAGRMSAREGLCLAALKNSAVIALSKTCAGEAAGSWQDSWETTLVRISIGVIPMG